VALTFTLNGHPFDGTFDAYGVQWVANCTGWDQSQLTTSLTARPGDHGAFRGSSYRNSRPYTLDGIAVCPNLTELRRAKDRLELVAPGGVDLDLTSAEDRTAIVQLAAGGILKTAPNEQTLRYSIALEAADPWKYGPQQSTTLPISAPSAGLGSLILFPLHLFSPTGGMIVNDGTVPARPTVTYWGPLTNPYSTNTDTGQTDAYEITLAAGEFLVVDHDLGSALLNGVSPRRNTRLPTAELWQIAPQSSTTIAAGAVSSGSGSRVDVAWSSTYL
jgi:hypothetical protein